MKINVSKIQVAEMQLNEAIFLFFDRANPIVIETLIGAVMGVLRSLGKKFGINAIFHDSDMVKEECKLLWIKKLHEAQNFAKHADTDSEDTLSYETDLLDFRIIEACYLFRHISSDKCLKYRQSKSCILYEIWFWHKYPELLKDPVETNQFLQEVGLAKSFNVDNFEMLKLVADRFRIKS